MQALLSIPYCHFKGLFDMAEMSEQSQQYSYMVGANAGGTNAGKNIAEAVEAVKYVDAIKFADIVTDKSKARAEKILKGLKANG